MQDETKNQQTDCLECRLVSGFGVIAIGVYVFSQARKRSRIEAIIMKLVSGGTVSLGIARLFNAPIFKGQRKNDS